MTSPRDTPVLVLSGAVGLAIALGLASTLLTAWAVLPVLGAAIAFAVYREVAPAAIAPDVPRRQKTLAASRASQPAS